MEDYNDIVFLDSEILDDDIDAPVGTLIKEGEPVSAVKTDEPQDKIAQEAVSANDNAQNEEQEVAQDAPVQEEEVSQEGSIQDEEETVEEVAPIENAEDKANNGEADGTANNQEIVEATAQAVENEPEKALEAEKADNNGEVQEQDEKPRATLKNNSQASVEPNKESIKLSSLDDPFGNALGKTTFEIEKPAKPVKIVSTKKKQEQSQDVWAVAPVAQKKKVAPEPSNDVKPAQTKSSKTKKIDDAKSTAPKQAEEVKPAPKSTQKATKVENKKDTKAEAKMAKETKVEATEPVKKTATKVDTNEKVLVPGDDSIPHGKFVIKNTDKGNYVYKLYSYNYRVVAIGAEQYSALPSCKGGIQSVIKNAATAPIEDLTLKNPVEQKCPKWVIYKDKKEEFRLRLIASNGNIVATTNDGYLSKDAAKKGIEAIARAAKGASIVRNDNLW